jgi:ribonuclease D
VQELASLKGMSPRTAKSEGRDLLQQLRRVEALPEASLRPYPNHARSGFGRPSPEEEKQAESVRDLRTRRAEELGIDRGVLLPNATIAEIIRAKPETVEELEAIDGVRAWQAALMGQEITRILRGK